MSYYWDDNAGEYLWADDTGNNTIDVGNDTAAVSNDTVSGGGTPDSAVNNDWAASMTTVVNADGSKTYTDPDGQTYTVKPNGTWVTGSGANESTFDPVTGKFTGTPTASIASWLNQRLGTQFTPQQFLRMGALGLGGIAGMAGLNRPNIEKVGYQGGLKDLVAQRTMATAPVAGYRPGAGGTNYGGDVQYTERSANAAAPAAPVQTLQPRTTEEVNPWAGKMNRGFATPGTAASAGISGATTASNVMTPEQLAAAQRNAGEITHAAQGGIMGLAHGGRYLQGDTDGMADKLRTSIDGKQPAALSHGEFVIPADVVSHLGNGNSDAGAKKLYSMMDKIRQARTGTKKQGKQINPDKFMPGGLASAYAEGGKVMGFAGETGSYVPAGTTGIDQTLAGWTGSYAPNMLAKTEALTSTPMPQYTGPLTAGASNLQNQAFAGASENAQAGYNPTQFQTGTFNTQAAQQYMNPYLQAALDPQIAEARRQSDITAQQNNATMTKAGAFGGGRQAILTSENQRNLGTNLANIVGTGYKTAYDKAMDQFNAEQGRNLTAQEDTEKSRQYGAEYGRNTLKDLADLGATQRGITAEGIAADKKAFEDARNAPYEQLKFQSQMLNGLPISATNYSKEMPSVLSDIASGATTVDEALVRLGLVAPTPKK